MMTLTVDKTVPEHAEMLAGCKRGDKLTLTATVASDAPDEAILEVDSLAYAAKKPKAAPEPVEEDGDDYESESEPMPPQRKGRGNPAIAIMLTKGK